MVVFLVVLSGFVLGCRGDSRFLPTYPVRGQVFFEGKPATGVIVTFHGPIGKENPWTRPRGSVDEDGNFVPETYRNADGAPAGTYRLTIASRSGQVVGVLLPQRYTEPDTSGLTAEVKPGDNVLPRFDLSR
jgi:hypothetical protein